MSTKCQKQTFRLSLNYLVGTQQDRLRNIDAQCFGRLQVQYKFEFGGSFNRQIGV
jgi:hypothetical protein